MSGADFVDYRTVNRPTKAHRCVWCHETIAIGERHLRYVGVWQGDFQDWRVHLECEPYLIHSDPSEGICEEKHRRGSSWCVGNTEYHDRREALRVVEGMDAERREGR